MKSLDARISLNDIMPILAEFTESAKSIYGQHLKKVILFGSFARNEQTADSDIDVFLIVDMSVDELKKFDHDISDASYDVTILYDIPMYPIAVSQQQFERYRNVSQFYQNVCHDGKIIYSRD